MKRSFIIICCVISLECHAQTCCTGGIPYLGVFKIPTLSNKQFGFNFSYSFNKNSNLILLDKRISENTLTRYVNTLLIQSDFAFSDFISVSLVLPYIKQKEVITLTANSAQIDNNGLGDISIWSTFKPTIGNNTYAISFAIKIPNGATNASDPETGIDYPLSFQTGSGSWDFIINLYNELPIDSKKRFLWINQISSKVNTKGKKFDTHPGYKFGSTIQLFSSFAYNLVIGQHLANTFAGIAYQYRVMDEYKYGYNNENTGGKWIFATLGYNHQFSQNLDFGFSGSFPLYSKVNGLQLSTSAQVNFTIGFKISA